MTDDSQNEPLPTTPDAVEIAMDAEASGREPQGPARRLLERHIRLTEEQIGLARNERFRNRIKAVRDLALAALVLALLVGGGGVLWSAHRAQGLVVEAMSVPPDMAAQGLDGSVVAARLLDKLSAMQAATDSSRAPGSYSRNWGDDLSIEVPETGLSVGQIWSLLKARLGRETRMSGDVAHTPDGGLIVSTRFGAQPASTFTGGADDLDALLQQSAERLYRQTQPYRYSVWKGRTEAGFYDGAVLAELAYSQDETERLWALVGQSVNDLDAGRPEAAAAKAREALALDPDFYKARWNLTDALDALGQDEALLRENRRLMSDMRRHDPRVTRASHDQVRLGAEANVAWLTRDWRSVGDISARKSRLPDYSGGAAASAYVVAESAVRLHDLSRGRALRMAADQSPRAMPGVSLVQRVIAATEAGDAALAGRLAVKPAEALITAGPTVSASAYTGDLAVALASAGDWPRAEALISSQRPDCYACILARARLAEMRGDRAVADRWFARATRLGPSLPEGFQRWGEAKLRRGDAAGALDLFRRAADLGPRWADPLKGQGDAQMALGQPRRALEAYEAVAERVPRWGALHLAWARALAAVGQTEKAAEKRRAALGMDLTAADRAAAGR